MTTQQQELTVTYRIQINAIDCTYDATSEDAALDAYAQDAGYPSWSALCDEHPVTDEDALIVSAVD